MVAMELSHVARAPLQNTILQIGSILMEEGNQKNALAYPRSIAWVADVSRTSGSNRAIRRIRKEQTMDYHTHVKWRCSCA